ncbi:MAG: hypothetical protein RBQ87_07935, partial [Candidatus Cloacimonadaceae bacterium]|nr:hypothetical protein [Candidatus Cloacimonadaceae bacterium]
ALRGGVLDWIRLVSSETYKLQVTSYKLPGLDWIRLVSSENYKLQVTSCQGWIGYVSCPVRPEVLEKVTHKLKKQLKSSSPTQFAEKPPQKESRF